MTDIIENAKSYGNDALITAEIKAKILADGILEGLLVEIETNDSIVCLTSENLSSKQQIRVKDIAVSTIGVKKVFTNWDVENILD